MRNIKIFVGNVFSLNQQDFWITVFCNLSAGLAVHLFNTHVFVEVALILTMMLKSFTFFRLSSVMPAVSSDYDRFSWKYFQGLPLTKKEILTSLVICDFLAIFPFFTWIIAFHSQIGDFFGMEESVAWSTKLKFFAILFTLIPMSSFFSLRNLLLLPRKQYSNADKRLLVYEKAAKLLILSVLVTYGLVGLKLLNTYFGIDVATYILTALKTCYDIIVTWWIVPVLLSVVVLLYSATLRAWQDEKIGYIRNKFDLKKSLGFITVTCLAQVYFFQNVDFNTPRYYADSPLLNSIHKQQENKIYSELEKADINKPNKYGITPLMAAAREGNLKLVKLLLNSGASLEGRVNDPESDDVHGKGVLQLAIMSNKPEIVQHLLEKGASPSELNKYNGHSPLHVAAMFCNTKIFDVLIQHKTPLNHRTQKGNTPLHAVAMRPNCYGPAVSLLDAGADPTIKNKEGLLALEIADKTRKSGELAYYLDKKTRRPAGKSN